MRGTIDDEKEGWFPASCVRKLAGEFGITLFKKIVNVQARIF